MVRLLQLAMMDKKDLAEKMKSDINEMEKIVSIIKKWKNQKK